MIAATFLALNLAAVSPAEATAVPPPEAPSVIDAPVTDSSLSEPAPAVPSQSPSPPSAQVPTATTEPAATAEAQTSVPSTEAATPSGNDQTDDLELELSKATNDPLEGFNRISFKVSMAIDKVVIRPAAMVYRHVVPKPARDGAHNALSNLGEPLVFLNDLLQLKPKRALRTLARFLLNSTLGLGGLFDVAKRKPYNLPHHANGLGDTLGYYGVKPGPYLYLPVLGPTTLRDTLGGVEGVLPLSKIVGDPLTRSDFQTTTTIVDGLDRRERNDDDLKAMLSDAIDAYATFRANYLQDRAGEIEALKTKDGEPAPAPALNEPLTDPAAPSAQK